VHTHFNMSNFTIFTVWFGNTQEFNAVAQLMHRFNICRTNLADTLISEREDADIQELAVQILALQVRLQASLQTTALISQLSLVNFI